MREPRRAADRFLALVDQRLVPPFSALGFERRRTVLEHRVDADVRWLVEVELAPWSRPEKISFTLSWGVAVPRLDALLGHQSPARTAQCPVHGRLGESDARLEAAWYTVGPLPRWLASVPGAARIADARTASSVLATSGAELLPALRSFDSVPAVQAHLVDGLVRGRGAAGDGELVRIRRIAGLSALLGERENSARWLDYLEARSSSSMAPDLVAERLSVLREQCLAS